MHITVFGILWIIISLYFIFFKGIKEAIFITLLSMIFQCNNIMSFGGMNIGVQSFTAAIACIRFLPRIINKAKGNNFSAFAYSILLLLFVIALSLVNNHLFFAKLIPFIMIFVYGIVTLFIWQNRNVALIDSEWIRSSLEKIIVIVLALGALQFLCITGVLPIRPLLQTFIFNDINNTDVIFHSKPHAYCLYASFMEPSYCGQFFVAAFCVIALKPTLKLKDIVLFASILLEILLTQSSTAYGALVVSIMLMTFVRSKKKVIKTMMPVLIIAATVMFLFFHDVLDAVIFMKSSSSSFRVRTNLNTEAMMNFKANPLLGVGYGNSRASSIVHTILGEMGMIGIVGFANLVMSNMKIAFSKNDNSYLAMSIFSIFVCQIIACPDLNSSILWMFIMALACSCNAWRTYEYDS